jgi:heme exporter protein CcmD
MMDVTADHAGFVIAAYAIVFAVLAFVVGKTVVEANTLKQRLKAQNLADPGQKDVP